MGERVGLGREILRDLEETFPLLSEAALRRVVKGEGR